MRSPCNFSLLATQTSRLLWIWLAAVTHGRFVSDEIAEVRVHNVHRGQQRIYRHPSVYGHDGSVASGRSEACSEQPESLSVAIGGNLMCVGGVVGEGGGRTGINRTACHVCQHVGSAGHL